MRKIVVEQRLDQLPVRMEQLELKVGEMSVTYGLLAPKSEPPADGFPLIVGLHYGTAQEPGLSPYFGLGYVGQQVYPALRELDAVIIAPDAPEATWSHPSSEQAVLAIVEQVRKDLKIDARKTLVTGFSMGGYGAWYFAATHGDLFRAAIPIAAMPLVVPAKSTKEVNAAVLALEGNADWPDALLKTPICAIHSRADQVVPFEPAERAVRHLQEKGGHARLIAVDGIPHHMTSAFVEPLAQAAGWIREVWSA